MPQGVGNGGLSLRSVPAMLELARAYGNSSGTQQEDFVWSGVMEQQPERYRLAPREAAYRFCVEVPCEDLEKGRQPGGPAQTLPALPLALHASWCAPPLPLLGGFASRPQQAALGPAGTAQGQHCSVLWS